MERRQQGQGDDVRHRLLTSNGVLASGGGETPPRKQVAKSFQSNSHDEVIHVHPCQITNGYAAVTVKLLGAAYLTEKQIL